LAIRLRTATKLVENGKGKKQKKEKNFLHMTTAISAPLLGPFHE
jgi:hypothetical protein